MAESVSLSSNLQSLATGARQTCTGILRTIKDVKYIGLEEFKKELEALATTLHSLTTSDTDPSALRLPLQECRIACGKFGQQIEQCLSPASGSSILGFRQLLAAYKATFDIALEWPNLHRTSFRIENSNHYMALIRHAMEQVSHVQVELTMCPSSEEALLKRQKSLTECMTYTTAFLQALNDILNEYEDRIQSTTKGSGSSSPHTDPEAILTSEYTPGEVSSIVNYGKADVLQVSVIGERPMIIRNYGSGPKTRQIAGEMSNKTLRELSQALSGNVLHNTRNLAGEIRDP